MATQEKDQLEGSKGNVKRGLLPLIRHRLLTGLVVTAPIALTVWLVWGILTFIDTKIKPLIPPQWNPETYFGIVLPGIGLLFVLGGLFLVGSITTNLLGRSILSMGERVVRRVPLVNNVYAALKQIFEAVGNRPENTFTDVVLIPYPRQGLWGVGFVTTPIKGEMAEKLPGLVGIFIPTTPNPTSGFLIYAPPEDLIQLNISVEDGAKLVVSGGLIVPEIMPDIVRPTPRLGTSQSRRNT